MAHRTPRRITDFNRSALHLLHRADQRATELFNRDLEAAQLTVRQFTVLLAIKREPGSSQSALGAATGIDSSTLADIVRRLRERRLVEVGSAADDRRLHRLTLTGEGRRVLGECQTRAAEAERILLRRLPAAARGDFMASLARLAGESAEPAARAPAKRG
jgi:DNA-binding MarR family transcriptional regulator